MGGSKSHAVLGFSRHLLGPFSGQWENYDLNVGGVPPRHDGYQTTSFSLLFYRTGIPINPSLSIILVSASSIRFGKQLRKLMMEEASVVGHHEDIHLLLD